MLLVVIMSRKRKTKQLKYKEYIEIPKESFQFNYS